MTIFPKFPTNGGNTYYTVKSGDTLPSIAAMLNLPAWEPLFHANKHLIGANMTLHPGTRLVVPWA